MSGRFVGRNELTDKFPAFRVQRICRCRASHEQYASGISKEDPDVRFEEMRKPSV